MSEFLRIKCPKCLQELKVASSSRGKSLRCPKCNAKLRFAASAAEQQHASVGAPEKRQLNSPLVPVPIGKQASSRSKRSTTSSPVGIENTPVNVAVSAPNQEPRQSEADTVTVKSPDPQPPQAKRSAAPVIASRVSDAANPFDIDLPPVAISKNSGGYAAKLNRTAELRRQITTQLTGEIPQRRVSFGYRLGLLFTAALVLALPLAYTAVIGLSGYGMFYYATEIMPDLMGSLPMGRVALFAILIYLTPVVVGCIVLIFMVKPLFIALIPSSASRQRFIRRETEPMLFDLVDRICDVTGAPRPSRIKIDCDVNASASYGRGFVSLFRSDLVLTIGMPLVEGLSAKQFAGVLAHEFGHFSQGAGMRASFIIRSINMWFARVVYQRDEVDETLESWIHDSDFRIALVLLVAQIFVGITRTILWLFMMVAHAASSFLLRQMEFDADRYEVQISGSKCFAETCHQLRLLGRGQSDTMAGLAKLINRGVLVDHLPKMVRIARDRLPLSERRMVTKEQQQETTGFFDSHPCDTQRIEAAGKINADGMLNTDAAAMDLFSNYHALSSGVTQDFYRNQLGRLVKPDELEPIESHMDKAFG